MRNTSRNAAINTKAVAILALVVILLGAGLVGGHYYRKKSIAQNALNAGHAALAARNYPDAAKQFRIYLSKYPDDEEILAKYAETCLTIRPMRPGDLSNAIKAYRRIFRKRMGDKELSERLAKLYFASGDFVETSYIARQRLAVASSDANAAIWQARSLIGVRKLKEAGEFLTNFIENNQSAPVEMYAMLSDIALQEDNSTEKAFNWLDLAVKKNPESPDALAARARFYIQTKQDTAKGRADLEAADRLAPADPKVRLLLAEQWLQVHDLDRTEAELHAIKGAASQPYEFEFEEQDMALALFKVSARLAMRRADRERMVELADKALAELKDKHRFLALDDAARLYLTAGKHDEARRCIEEFRAPVKQTEQSSPVINERLAILDAALANSENKPYEAIRHLEDIITVGQARDELIWRYLAHAYSQTGQDRRALAALEKYVERASDDRTALLEVARLHYKMGEWGNVQKYAQMAENLKQDDLEAILLRMEGTLRLLGPKPNPVRVTQISEELDNLRKYYPKRVEVRLLQAMLADAQEKKDEAIQILNDAIRECDQPLIATIQLAEMFRNAGKYEDAIRVCREGMEQYKEAAILPITLAEAQRAAGKKEDAGQTLELAAAGLPPEESAKAKLVLARFLTEDAPADAAMLLRQMAKDRPKDVAARQAMLDLPEIQSDEAKAQRIIDEIRAIEGERGLRWSYEQARLLLRNPAWKSRQQEIIQLLTRCSDGDPGWNAPVLTLGWIYESLGKDDKAEELYNRFIDKNPRSMSVVSRLLEMLERQGRFIAATQILERLPSSAQLDDHRARLAIGRGDYETAMRDLKGRIAANPKDAASRILLARLIYQHTRDVEAALKLLEEAQQHAPQFISAVSTRVALLHAEGRKDDAIALLNAEVQRRNDFFAHQLRAEYYAMIGEKEKAEEDYKTLTTFASSAVEGHLKLGNFYENTGRHDDAIAAYEEALRVDSGRSDVRRALVRALLFHSDEKHRERGRQLLEKMLAENPQEPSLVALQAVTLLKQNKPETKSQAIALLERVVDLDPRNVVAHIHLIRDAIDRGEMSKAAQLVSRALGANPGDVDLLLIRANIEKELNNRVAAKESARQALERDPSSVAARTLLVQLALENGELEEAEKLNNEAIKLSPDRLDVQLAAAEILVAKKQDDQAIEKLEAYRATETGQKSAKVAITLADLYRKRGDFAKSAERVDNAEKIAPDEFTVFFARLRLYAAQKEIDKLIQLLADRIKVRPNEAPALTSTAAVLISQKDTANMERVKPLFEGFIENNPKNADGHLAMAILAYQTNDKPRAIKAYQRVLEIDPYQREALNNLAWILAEDEKKYQEAVELANKGALRYPDDPSMLNTRGVIFFHLNRLEEANQDLQKCIRLSGVGPGTRARSLIYLGRIAFRQGEKEKAKTLLAEAQDIENKSQVLSAKEREDLQKLIGDPATKPANG